MSDCQRASLGVGCIHQCPSAAQAGWGWPRTVLAMAPSMPARWELPVGLAEPLEEAVRPWGCAGSQWMLPGLWCGSGSPKGPSAPAGLWGLLRSPVLHNGPGAAGRAVERATSTQGHPPHPHAGQPEGHRGPWGQQWALDPPKKVWVPAGGCGCPGCLGRAGLGSGLPRCWECGAGARGLLLSQKLWH